jgi:NAD(P)-dependent dehydrogenase (short-subunit alcohol dehydrogenase family)
VGRTLVRCRNRTAPRGCVVELGLTGKVAVVTGASKGIGLAIVKALVEEGAHVVAAARTSSPALKALAEAGSVQFVSVDLSRPDGPSELVAAAGSPIDILVNNVGMVIPRLEGFLAVADSEWEASLNLNFMAAVRTIRSALPGMLEAGQGSIVNISSVNAFLPDPSIPDYCAAKAALTNFSKAISKEVGRRGVRINTVSPGPVATDLWLGADGVAASVGRATGKSPESVASEAAEASSTGRFTQPEEVAALVLLLVSDRAPNVTGTDFTIDGGLISTV